MKPMFGFAAHWIANTEMMDMFVPATPLFDDPFYVGLNPCSRTLPKGTVVKDGHLPLPCDILLEQDIEVRVRDGARLYVDVYRPPGAKPGIVPAIFVFTPFGKQGGPNRYNFDRREWRCGVPRKCVSGLEVFEGPDPAYWCFHGYAVVYMRGTWNSDGNAMLPCVEQVQDGHDLVEWIAGRERCNGRVSMAGNSFLAATQWFVGAEQPPHLACLAPWEGFNDLYNDQVRRGGILNAGFAQGLLRGDLRGKSSVEDVVKMTENNPVWTLFWETHQADLKKIQVPLYVVASWTNPLHAHGTLKGFIESSSPEKWLRVHNFHEWPDLYQPQNLESLRSFFDHYMKDVNNDWVFTPRVRLSILNPGGQDIVNRPETTYPLTRQRPWQLFLDANSNCLQSDIPKESTRCVYDAMNGLRSFDYRVPRKMEFIGPSKLRLFVEAEGSDDMDVFVTLEKCNSSGDVQKSIVIDVGWLADDPEAEREALLAANRRDSAFCSSYFSAGPCGSLRVSHRAVDEARSTEYQPVYTHAKEKALRVGEIVPADIEIWPYGWCFETGDILRLTRHILHTGRASVSYLLLPLVSSD
ncbi:hydrolase CocE/NonD family protein [Aspergillus sclerotiicarbonarius CBS 121057]|uniref:Hydrolase CocE/NonD family protein n=1 Tax=Aspergillus sclerotiicarbonarius (strain CBS 121057 / IBT 28362) TaxID=1448318 RepID=A0A319F9Z2_ASPSB|nr:hydrolase CocE/NonD family protein [Aspergillus sclerotiicarbonarius CBS 121057]